MKRKKLLKIPCPKCGKPADWYDNLYRPFCSERCKILDLGAWAAEEYRFLGESSFNEEEQEKFEEEAG